MISAKFFHLKRQRTDVVYGEVYYKERGKREEEAGEAEKQQVPSEGGPVYLQLFRFLPCFLPVAGTSITRVVSVIIRGRDTRGRDTKKEKQCDGAGERAKDARFAAATRVSKGVWTAPNRVPAAKYSSAILR